MERKQRVTIDSAGLRIRPRTYAETHVPKRVTPRMVHDVSSAHQSTVPTQHISTIKTPEVSTHQAAVFARSLIDQRRTVPDTPYAVPPKQDEVLGDLVQSIQHAQESINIPANYESQSNRAVQPLDDETTVKKTSGLKRILQKITAQGTYRSVALSATAVLLVVGGVVALLSSVRSSRLVTMQVQALSEKSDQQDDADSGQNSSASDVPSEDKIPEAVTNSYSVATDLPRYISIPKIKIKKTRVLRMGLDKDGAIKTPRNVWDTGWYDGSSKPGDTTGAALIVGHVSGPTNGGIFYNLYRIAIGDDINVTQGDGTVLNYKVVAKEEVPAQDMNMNNYLISKNVDKAGLTLMTCAGEYNPKTHEYDKRLAVFAIRSN